jgi:hypothetical protein
MRNRFHTLATFITIAFLSSTAVAQKGNVKIAVKTDAAPASSIGLIISDQGVAQKLNTIVDAGKNEGEYRVSFPFKKSGAAAEAVATALIVSEDGSVSYGNTVSLRDGSPNSAQDKTPECSVVDRARVAEVINTGQHSLIESLVRVREERRALLKNQVQEVLSDSFLIRLRNIEAGFGLNHEGEISADMSPMELNDRLTRIIHAIKTYQAHQAYKKRMAQGF